MKKTLFTIAFLAITMSASAQWTNILGNLFGGSSTASSDDKTTTTTSTVKDALTGVLGNLIGQSVPVSTSTIEGTWNYNGVSCVLESDQALTNIGGSVVTSQIESKLDTYLAKIGVAPGACTFAFHSNDSCTFTVKGRDINGTYQLNSEEKTIQFQFYGRLNMTAHVSYNLSELNLVFDADKLLSLIKKVSSTVSSKSSGLSSLLGGGGTDTTSAASTASLQAISSLLDNYTGMMLGMKLQK